MQSIDLIEKEIDLQTAARALAAIELKNFDVRLDQLKTDLSRAKAANSQNCLIAERLEHMAKAVRNGTGYVFNPSHTFSRHTGPVSTFEIRTAWDTAVLTTPRLL